MTNFYFTDTNGQKHSLDDQQLKALVAQGLITLHTPLETEGGHKGLAGQIPGLFDATPSSFAQTVQVPLSPTAETIRKLNTYFKVFWICMVAGLLLCFIFVGIPVVIAGAVFGVMLHYQLWKLIPPDIARTTPGKAVGFCFIPFFNLYWVFVAYKGLCEDLNKALRQCGVQHQVNEGLGLTICILYIVSFTIAIIGSTMMLESLIALAGITVLIIFFKTVKDGAIALLEQEGH